MYLFTTTTFSFTPKTHNQNLYMLSVTLSVGVSFRFPCSKHFLLQAAFRFVSHAANTSNSIAVCLLFCFPCSKHLCSILQSVFRFIHFPMQQTLISRILHSVCYSPPFVSFSMQQTLIILQSVFRLGSHAANTFHLSHILQSAVFRFVFHAANTYNYYSLR